MRFSHLEGLSVEELMAFIFLAEEGVSSDKRKGAILNPALADRWIERKAELEKLIRFYPNEEEEKHYLTATIEAVMDIDPYSDEAREKKERYSGLIKTLLEPKS